MLPRQRRIIMLFIPLTVVALALVGVLLGQDGSAGVDAWAFGPAFNNLTLYLSTFDIQLLELIALAPLFVALIFAWQSEKPNLDYFQPELTGVYGLWISFVNGYVVAYILLLVGIIPKLESLTTFFEASYFLPANYLAVVIVIATIAGFIWFIFGRKSGFGRIADRIQLPHRRLVLLILLTLVDLTAIILNGYTTFVLAIFVIPTWVWILIEPRTNRSGKIMNVVMAFVAFLPSLFIIFIFYAASFTVEPLRFVWWLISGAVYGIISPLDVLLSFFWLALVIRFLRLGLSEPYIMPPPQPSQSEIIEQLLK